MSISGKNYGLKFKFKKFKMESPKGWDIYDVYDRPSMLKVNAWNFYTEWFEHIGGDGYLYIGGYNSCSYTIYGKINVNGSSYFIKITKDNRYIMEA